MNQVERYAAVKGSLFLVMVACKYVDMVVQDAPYFTQVDFVKKYGCDLVVHGDGTYSHDNISHIHYT